MVEIRVHGRGGMGAVTLVEVLAKAAGLDGKYSQAFPAFGPERRGAPVKAFCRLSDSAITLRSQIYNPDYVIVLDPSLLSLPETTEGMKPGSVLIVNSSSAPKQADHGHKAFSFDAASLAARVLGKPIVNTAMLGVFAKITDMVSLHSVLTVIGEKFPGKVGEMNKKLVEESYSQAAKA
jgi:pyruvate ferredoxin oxidoreductase gamma subunit